MTREQGPGASAGASYTYGYSEGVVAVHAGRTAAREAAFFLPSMRPGTRLLDVGCGPGSITLGLAAAVAPGEAVGLDVEESVLDAARERAAVDGVTNVRFEAGDVAALPFPDGSFDAVFAHTLLEHVGDGGAALREMRRVLRPGGVIGVRDCDWGSGVIAPDNGSVAMAMTLYARVWRHNGGHPHCGRYLRGMLTEGGFTRIETSTSFRWDGTPAETRDFGELLAHRLALPAFAGPILALGICDHPRLERIAADCRAWSRRPDAFAAMMMVEAIGRVAPAA